MSDPQFIDHRDGNTLLAALHATLPGPGPPGAAEAQAGLLDEICIATAFFSPAGFGAIGERLHRAPRLRLLLGAEVPPEATRPQRRPGHPPPAVFQAAQVRDGLEALTKGLREERNRLPFTRANASHLRLLGHMLRSNKLETRRYTRAFLHAKAYIFDGLAQGFIAGSSNLTRAGLTTNQELNLGLWNTPVFAKARAWFQALWEESEPFDLAAFFEEIEAAFTPYQIFLRVLWQLYGAELDQERQEDGEIPLTAFQKHGVWRARRILRDHGGVIVADEVGLGKTYIAGEIMSAYARNRQRVLLVCPAALRDTTWGDFLYRFDISRWVECVSYEQLGRDKQFADARRPHATLNVLKPNIEEYALVVVDEAHNYRNPDSPYRAAVLRQLLFGPRKDLLLLTATPVNNSLWDLFHLIRFFVRQDSVLAPQGIVSIRERFEQAARLDPSDLHPDLLYPVIDAVTVKRTRGFVKLYYAGETFRAPDGSLQPIVFPKPQAIALRYELEAALPGFFAEVADALDPDHGTTLLRFARYSPEAYRIDADPEDVRQAEISSGLLRSGLLKRFESSAHAFTTSLRRMLDQHETFLTALDQGKVIATAFFAELSATDEAEFDGLLASSTHASDAAGYDRARLRTDVTRDRDILAALTARAAHITAANDPKLAALVEALAAIAIEAEHDATDPAMAQRDRKVLLFSFYADTIGWLRRVLAERIEADPRLAAYRGRIVAVAGSADVEEAEDVGRQRAVWGFAPDTTRPPPGETEDRYDLLLSTDVLAEGMNLQQARHIINYDLPWNPMRLVQRHGRIDRIGSLHPRVFLRTIFPADTLEALLNLEARILRKLTQAARSIGVGTAPIGGAEAEERVFAETRAEIERLAAQDPTLYERGGTVAAAQTGEEYRQRLRAALEDDRAGVVDLPGKGASGLRQGTRSGVFFCAEVEMASGVRSFLRFVPARLGWTPDPAPGTIEREVGTCLRLIECTDKTPRVMPEGIADAVFGFWEAAEADILAEWEFLSDPANLHPTVRRLNREVAAFIRANPPLDASTDDVARALDIVEAPWAARDERALRETFGALTGPARQRSREIVAWILATGLEPFTAAEPLPALGPEDIRLVCWMAVSEQT